MSNDSGIHSLKVFKLSLERVQNLPQQVLAISLISHVGLELVYQLSFVTCIVDCMIVCVCLCQRESVYFRKYTSAHLKRIRLKCHMNPM